MDGANSETGEAMAAGAARAPGIGFGLERIGLAALARPSLAATILILVSLVSIFGLTRLYYDDDVVRAFRSGSPSYARFLEVEREHGDVLYNIGVVASRDRPLDAADLTVLRELHFELEFIDNVDAVLSLFAMRELKPGLEAGPAIVPDEITDADLPGIFSRAEGDRAWPGRAVSADRKALSFVVIDNGAGRSRVERRALVDAVRAAAAAARASGLDVEIVGADVIRFEIADSIKRDILLFTLGGAFISLLLALWWFRNWRLATLAFLPSLAAVGWMLGFAGLSGMPVSVTTDVVPVLLIVMSFSDGMHIVHALRREKVADRAGLDAALARVIAQTGPACALTSLTTAVSLLSFHLTGYGALTDLALLGGVGTLVAFVAVITVLPAIGRVLLRPQDLDFPDDGDSFGHRVSRRMTRFVPRHVRAIATAGVVLFAAGLVGQATTIPAFDTYENIPQHSATLAASLDAEDRFGGVFSVWTRIEARPGEPFDSPAGWARLTAIHAAAEAAMPGRAVVSPLTMARAAGHAAEPLSREEAERVPEWFVHRFGDASASVVWLAVFLGDPNRSDDAKAQFDALESAMASHGLGLAGSPALVRHDGPDLIQRMNIALLAASVTSIALIIFAFRNPWLAAAVALANVTPDLMISVALHIFEGGKLTVAGGLAMTIAFGIAIDDTIHVLNHIRHAVRHGKNARDAVIGTVGDMSPLLGATTVILIGGLALTLFSDFTTVRSFGLLSMLILAFAVFGDLLILPAVLLLNRKWATR